MSTYLSVNLMGASDGLAGPNVSRRYVSPVVAPTLDAHRTLAVDWLPENWDRVNKAIQHGWSPKKWMIKIDMILAANNGGVYSEEGGLVPTDLASVDTFDGTSAVPLQGAVSAGEASQLDLSAWDPGYAINATQEALPRPLTGMGTINGVLVAWRPLTGPQSRLEIDRFRFIDDAIGSTQIFAYAKLAMAGDLVWAEGDQMGDLVEFWLPDSEDVLQATTTSYSIRSLPYDTEQTTQGLLTVGSSESPDDVYAACRLQATAGFPFLFHHFSIQCWWHETHPFPRP